MHPLYQRLTFFSLYPNIRCLPELFQIFFLISFQPFITCFFRLSTIRCFGFFQFLFCKVLQFFLFHLQRGRITYHLLQYNRNPFLSLQLKKAGCLQLQRFSLHQKPLCRCFAGKNSVTASASDSQSARLCSTFIIKQRTLLFQLIHVQFPPERPVIHNRICLSCMVLHISLQL